MHNISKIFMCILLGKKLYTLKHILHTTLVRENMFNGFTEFSSLNSVLSLYSLSIFVHDPRALVPFFFIQTDHFVYY